jgi:hypothetical protein
MSWQIAAMVASSALKAVEAKKAANAQEYAARVRAQQYDQQAKLARLKAEQEEVSRRRDLAELEATNNATVSYDALSSPSFLAIRGENKNLLESQIKNIQLLGAINQNAAEQNSLLQSRTADIARFSGSTAFASEGLSLGNKLLKLGPGKAPTGFTNTAQNYPDAEGF